MSNSKSFDLFFASTPQNREPSHSIDYLAENYGEDIFQTLLNTLLNKNFSKQEASELWRAAMRHFSQESARINWRAVVLDYLLSRPEHLSNPRIVEAEELRRLQLSAVTDGLTNLYNQSHFKQRLAAIIKEHEEQPGATFSLLMLDLDHFKQFNDRCGHLCGDQVLKEVGMLICSQLPENCLAARYGGEEFAVILPQMDLPEAVALAERIRAKIEANSFAGENRLDSGNLTISGGIACYPAAGKTSDALIAQADAKLYEAKLYRNSIAPRTNEVRHIIRHNVRSIVEIFDHSSGDFKNALSADISLTGILLKSSTPAVIGSNLKMRFPYPFWPSDHYTSGQVMHVRKSGHHGAFLVGIQFLQPQGEFIDEILPGEMYTAAL